MKLQGQVAWLTRQMFGRKGEKLTDDAQAGLFEHLHEDTTPAQDDAPEQTQTITYERRSTNRGKRQPIPDHLPRREVIHDLPEDQKANRKRIGQAVSEQLEYEPASIYVIRHIRYQYAPIDDLMLDASGELLGVIVARKPVTAIEKGLAGPGDQGFWRRSQ